MQCTIVSVGKNTIAIESAESTDELNVVHKQSLNYRQAEHWSIIYPSVLQDTF